MHPGSCCSCWGSSILASAPASRVLQPLTESKWRCWDLARGQGRRWPEVRWPWQSSVLPWQSTAAWQLLEACKTSRYRVHAVSTDRDCFPCMCWVFLTPPNLLMCENRDKFQLEASGLKVWNLERQCCLSYSFGLAASVFKWGADPCPASTLLFEMLFYFLFFEWCLC